MAKPTDYVDVQRISSILSQLEQSKTPNILEQVNQDQSPDEGEYSSNNHSLALKQEDGAVSLQDNKRRSTKRKGSALDEVDPSKKKRKRFLWSDELHRKFVAAIFDYGLKEITPKTLGAMLEGTCEDLTSDNIKSHLQKYRLNAQKGRSEFLHYYDRSCKLFQEQQSKGLLTDSQMTKFGIYPFSPEPACLSLNGPSDFQDYSCYDMKSMPNYQPLTNSDSANSLSSYAAPSTLMTMSERETDSNAIPSAPSSSLFPSANYHPNHNYNSSYTFSSNGSSLQNEDVRHPSYSPRETIDTTHILVNNQEAKVYSPGYPPSSTDLSDPPHDSTPEHMNSFKSFGHASPVLHMNSYSSSLYTSSPSSLSHNHTTENQGEEDAPLPAGSPMDGPHYSMQDGYYSNSSIAASSHSNLNIATDDHESNELNENRARLPSDQGRNTSAPLAMNNYLYANNTMEPSSSVGSSHPSLCSQEGFNPILSPSVMHSNTNNASNNNNMNEIYNDMIYTQMQLHQNINRQHETRQMNNGFINNLDVQEPMNNPVSLLDNLSFHMDDSFFPTQPTIIEDDNPWSFLQDN